jgi:DNA-binding transcriptional MerR regulator
MSALGCWRRPRGPQPATAIYGPADRDRLRFILKVKTVGLSLNEIRDIARTTRRTNEPFLAITTCE